MNNDKDKPMSFWKTFCLFLIIAYGGALLHGLIKWWKS